MGSVLTLRSLRCLLFNPLWSDHVLRKPQHQRRHPMQREQASLVDHPPDATSADRLEWWRTPRRARVQVSLPDTRVFSVNVRRNGPCPCGAAKKFKRCCLGKAGDWWTNQPSSESSPSTSPSSAPSADSISGTSPSATSLDHPMAMVDGHEASAPGWSITTAPTSV